uniref:Syndecan n=1 Tax=Tetraodon nigroviridis TaxID=99883 RepID=H3BXQ4_TETNG
MKNLRLLFVVGLAAGFIAATTSVFGADDLYLEGRSSGNFPLDDEDGEDDGSGSGSGDYGEKTSVCFLTICCHRTSPSSAPPFESTSLSTGIKEANEDNSLDRWERPTPTDIEDQHEIIEKGVTSENLWERTEVLAAVIACGVVGFLCAVSLLLFLAYRMKKKDEGSYDLGDNKLSNAQYHKAPTKEFYA